MPPNPQGTKKKKRTNPRQQKCQINLRRRRCRTASSSRHPSPYRREKTRVRVHSFDTPCCYFTLRNTFAPRTFHRSVRRSPRFVIFERVRKTEKQKNKKTILLTPAVRPPASSPIASLAPVTSPTVRPSHLPSPPLSLSSRRPGRAPTR